MKKKVIAAMVCTLALGAGPAVLAQAGENELFDLEFTVGGVKYDMSIDLTKGVVSDFGTKVREDETDYSIEFSPNSQTEYEFCIDSVTGWIKEFEWEFEDDSQTIEFSFENLLKPFLQ